MINYDLMLSGNCFLRALACYPV